MAYSAGSIILDDDYNTFATGSADGTPTQGTANLNSVWGTTGTVDYGYGQSGDLATVTAGGTVTATQWANMLSRLTTIANHQGTTITPITTPNAGDVISAYAALSSNITSAWSSKLNAAGNGSDNTITSVNTDTWDVSATNTLTVAFASAAQLRYFFNAGGNLRLSFSLTGGSDAKSIEWGDLLTQCGTIVVCGSATSKTIDSVTYTGTTKIGGSGTATILATGTGAQDYTAVATTIFQQYADTAPYTDNYVRIQATLSGSTITFSVLLQDDAADELTDPAGGDISADDIVDGTLTATATVRPPSTTYLSDTWGTVTPSWAGWTVTS